MSRVIAVRFEPYTAGPPHIHVYVTFTSYGKGEKKPDVNKFQTKGFCLIAKGGEKKKIKKMLSVVSELYIVAINNVNKTVNVVRSLQNVADGCTGRVGRPASRPASIWPPHRHVFFICKFVFCSCNRCTRTHRFLRGQQDPPNPES